MADENPCTDGGGSNSSSSSSSSNATNNGTSPDCGGSNPALGDALALCSAVLYGVYCVVLKWLIPDDDEDEKEEEEEEEEERGGARQQEQSMRPPKVRMHLFFGFLGERGPSLSTQVEQRNSSRSSLPPSVTTIAAALAAHRLSRQHTGLVNMALLWPLLPILDATGAEKFELPSGLTLAALVVNGLFGTVLSDYLWGQSVIYA